MPTIFVANIGNVLEKVATGEAELENCQGLMSRDVPETTERKTATRKVPRKGNA